MLGFANINLYGSSDYSQVEFNVHRPALQDKRVRQALIYGLDGEAIDVVYRGYSKSPSNRSRRSHGPLTLKASALTHDPAQAKKLLDEAGWKLAPTVSAPKTASAWS